MQPVPQNFSATAVHNLMLRKNGVPLLESCAFMSIAVNLQKIVATLPPGVRLVAVSKNHPVEDILIAYNAGQRLFGENKAQELSAKYGLLPADIEWHFIGHLQTNKVKYIAPFVSVIHSIDSLKLLLAINKEAAKNNRVIDGLLQFHIAGEETKFGMNLDEAIGLLGSEEITACQNVRLTGVMGMATFTDDRVQVSAEFQQLKTIFDHLKNQYFPNDSGFCEISMGMSDDYILAIEQGSTLVRVGSSIFGERN